jgi:hypothetical protein
MLTPLPRLVRIFASVAAVLYLGACGSSPTDASTADTAGTTVSLTLPASLLGTAKLDSPEYEKQVSATWAPVRDRLPAGATVKVGGYGDAGDPKKLLVVAIQGAVAEPEKTVKDIFADDDVMGGSPVHNLASHDPGPLGGHLSCADKNYPGRAPLSLCVWADGGSIGAVYFWGTPASDAAKKLPEARAAIEHDS